jgi:hypothetical protein
MANTGQRRGLARDFLDKLLLDRDNLPLGRADGIILLLAGERSQPQVVQIETGMATLVRRISRKFARALHRVWRRVGLTWKRPVRIDWSKIELTAAGLKVDVSGEQSPILAPERWLRDAIIRRIPGSGTRRASE